MGVDAAITLVLALIDRAAAISALVQKAQSENREISPDEWKSITDADDAARAGLVKAIG